MHPAGFYLRAWEAWIRRGVAPTATASLLYVIWQLRGAGATDPSGEVVSASFVSAAVLLLVVAGVLPWAADLLRPAPLELRWSTRSS